MTTGGGGELSAFDRLYQRLVVQGQSAAGKKNKKLKKAKSSGAARRDDQQDTEAAVNRSVPREEVKGVSVSQHLTTAADAPESEAQAEAAVVVALDEFALACVRRLKMRRNLRRARLGAGLSSDELSRFAIAGHDSSGGCTLRRSSHIPGRLRRSQTSITPDASARQWMRVEGIAAMLYRRTSNVGAATQSPPHRVLHDFCFPLSVKPAFQSQIHYTINSFRPSNAVPSPPSSNWIHKN